MYYLGLDVGTSGCKAGVYSIEGECIFQSAKRYSVDLPFPGWMELNVFDVWNACKTVLGECGAACGNMIKAMSVSSQGEAVFPVDREGTPLAPAITTFDTRTRRQTEELSSRVLKEQTDRTLRPVHSMFSASKILWHVENSPKAWKYMCFGDYISFMMTGEACIDYSLCSRTMLFDIQQKYWIDSIIDACSITKAQLSTPIPSTRVIGKLTKKAAEELSLSPEMLVVAGAHDQSCCAYGAGINKSGMVLDTLGTTESIFFVSNKHPTGTDYGDKIPCDAYLFDDHYAHLAFLSTSGQVLEWYKAKILDDRFSNEQLSISENKPTGILAYPYFAGSGTPRLNDSDLGRIIGLNLSTTRNDLYRAILEGTAYEAKVNMDNLTTKGLEIEEIVVVGGGSKSSEWVSIKANVYNKPLYSCGHTEAGTLGAAMIAALGCCDISNNETPWAKRNLLACPDPNISRAYAEVFDLYVQNMNVAVR